MPIYGNRIDYRISIINEAYFGKTETLLEIEKQIGIIRANAAKKFTDIDKSKEVQQLNRLFEKQFGMDVFSLHIEQNNTINAYTIPLATRFDIAFNEVLARKVVADKTGGYRFVKGNNFCIVCTVYLGLLKCENITDAEILAIILHELGHNFADAISANIAVANKDQTRGYFSFLMYKLVLSLILLIPSAGSSAVNIISVLKSYLSNLNSRVRRKEKSQRVKVISGILKGVSASCNDFAEYINTIFSRISGGRSIRRYIKNGTKKDMEENKKSEGRQNEVVADKFAAVYGYGPELSSGLLKMELTVSKAEMFVSEKFRQANNDFNEAIQELYKFDCHPHTMQRLNECIKTLQSELEKSGLDPKLVKIMKEQIKELEKIKEEATKITDNMTDKQKIAAKSNAKVLLEDPDALDEIMEIEITKAFDDMLED